jgi:hypothetical protein
MISTAVGAPLRLQWLIASLLTISSHGDIRPLWPPTAAVQVYHTAEWLWGDPVGSEMRNAANFYFILLLLLSTLCG